MCWAHLVKLKVRETRKCRAMNQARPAALEPQEERCGLGRARITGESPREADPYPLSVTVGGVSRGPCTCGNDLEELRILGADDLGQPLLVSGLTAV